MLYTKFNDVEPSEKPMALCIMPRNFKRMSYIMGFSVPVMEFLTEKYNLVILTGQKDDNEELLKYGQVWGIDQIYIKYLKSERFKRVDDLEDSNCEYNHNILTEEFVKTFGKGFFSKLSKILIFNPDDFILPLTSYVSKKEHLDLHLQQNEFHDSINPDTFELEKIKIANRKICKNFDAKCRILAFGSHFKNITVNLVKYAFKEAKNFDTAYAFINDPAFYSPIFEYENIPFKAYYFKDDKRGTRDYYEFPIGELQHIIWDGRNKKIDLLSFGSDKRKKDKSVFFAGTIFQEKGGRIELWEKYLKNLRVPDAGLYIPLRSNGILHSKSRNDKYLNKVKEVFSELLYDVENHPHYLGHLVPDEYEDQVARYKYGILFRCVSNYDSLNFRPILYARLRILPLLDPLYDPAYLQIPEYIQSKLLVYSHKDIEQKVKYFDENIEEREKLLDDLEELFSIKTFNKNWKNKLNNYF
jgi:hypothetical protein